MARYLKFEPTDEQRAFVRDRLSKGELAHSVRLDVINPETKKPIDPETFCKIFKDEVLDARAIRGTRVCSNLFAGAIASQKNNVTGMIERDAKLIQQWLALDGRGLFGMKFALDCTKPLAHQLNQVKKACADGLIGSQEMVGFVQAFMAEKEIVEVAHLRARLDAIEAKNGEFGQS